MNRFQIHVLIGALMLAVPAGHAHAATITFEGHAGFASGLGTSLVIDGFRFTITGGNDNALELITDQDDLVERFTTKLFAANHTEITMTREGGGAFDLVSLDLGGSWISFQNRWASSLSINGGVPVALPDNEFYKSVLLNFSNVTSVTFIPFMNSLGGENDFEFTLDNIEWADVAAVPDVGSTMPLLGLGLVCLGVMRFSYRS